MDLILILSAVLVIIVILISATSDESIREAKIRHYKRKYKKDVK